MKKRLSLIQMDVHVNEVEYNYVRVQELLSQALSEKPDIIVLPETWNTGFHPSKDLINISDRNGERTFCEFRLSGVIGIQMKLCILDLENRLMKY